MDSKEEKENVVMDEGVPKAADQAHTAHVLDKVAERRLCFKFDVRLMPVLAIMCKFSGSAPPVSC